MILFMESVFLVLWKMVSGNRKASPKCRYVLSVLYCFSGWYSFGATWNRQLLKEFGEMIAEEMEKFGVNLWLAPGMNIHRNPCADEL